MLVPRSLEPASKYIPIAAGTMVVGRVPKTPPTIPPHFSIATVTKTATNPANRADRIIVCIIRSSGNCGIDIRFLLDSRFELIFDSTLDFICNYTCIES